MNKKPTKIELIVDKNTILCSGAWTFSTIAQIEKQQSLHYPTEHEIIIDGSNVTKIDTAGAWWLERLVFDLEKAGKQITWRGFNDESKKLLDFVADKTSAVMQPSQAIKSPNIFYCIGKEAVAKWTELLKFLGFIGEFTLVLLIILRHPQEMQWRNLLVVIEEAGYYALPITALLSFLVGVVLTYQMGVQLQSYGANAYIVNFSGLAVLREFAPLITAIIVAGRTSSAITAQIGTMKINEEIDALLTMGLSPVSRLVVPKIFGVFIALPLLVLWANVFGVLGSMVMAKSMLNINYFDFLTRFQQVVNVNNYWIGIGKAPIFALIIALVGCFQGFQIGQGADSIGRQTTKSVVQAIFLIIIADAAFSIIFNWLGI